MEHPKEKVAKQFAAALPFSKALDMRLDEIGEGAAIMSMPYDERIIGDPETGVVHGGAVSALLDTCGGLAVFLHPDGVRPTATIDLRIDYMRAAKPGERIFADVHVQHAARTVAFVRGIAHDGNADDPVATVTGAFTFQHKGKS